MAFCHVQVQLRDPRAAQARGADVLSRSMAARFSVMMGIATVADKQALRGNEMMFGVEQMQGKHKMAALAFYR